MIYSKDLIHAVFVNLKEPFIYASIYTFFFFIFLLILCVIHSFGKLFSVDFFCTELYNSFVCEPPDCAVTSTCSFTSLLYVRYPFFFLFTFLRSNCQWDIDKIKMESPLISHQPLNVATSLRGSMPNGTESRNIQVNVCNIHCLYIKCYFVKDIILFVMYSMCIFHIINIIKFAILSCCLFVCLLKF